MQNTHLSNLQNAPTLVEIFRGENAKGQPIIEIVHRGLICVQNGLGEVMFARGDIKTLNHMRSTAKPFQVLPLLELGVFDDGASKLLPSDLTLMMSSHAGHSMHTSRVAELLARVGLSQKDLRCGIHPPQDDGTRKNLIRSMAKPTELHNNCSGKHTAMLMACLKHGFSIDNYEELNHPLQQRIHKLILDISDLAEQEIGMGIDGCSLPTLAMPLTNLTLMYARLAYWQEHLPEDKPPWLRAAFKRIWTAATSYPSYLAGDNRFDTELIRAGQEQIFSKTGADGMHAISVLPCKKYPTGLGIAIKIIDGDARQTIRPLVVKQLLSDLEIWPAEPKLDQFLPLFKNYRGLLTGGTIMHIDYAKA